MGKVFTITEGLENLGAMKTGGQGSVYKGRRIGEIITAIKLLPTPIHNESLDDKSYRDFINEVEKLKKVNEQPNPHVVTILSSGVTDSGNFPFIEMEYIEGPDLEDLLKPPHNPIFTIKEILKITDQLSDALAHCHKMDVRHGDIKSNNVKFNSKTGNYILLDFGLSAMSDEQRRTSLRHAGAIEFMAPEQNEGQMLFQTDVYSFGVILFELIAGRVPFPLHDRGETARNNVRLAHMETPPPDMLELRKAALPASWPDDKKQREMQVPEWVVNMVYKCLEKGPSHRFENGVQLHEYVITNSSSAEKNTVLSTAVANTNAESHSREKEQLQKVVLDLRHQVQAKDREVDELKAIIANTQNNRTSEPHAVYAQEPAQKGVSKNAFILLLLLTLGFGAFTAYSLFKGSGAEATTTSLSDSTQYKIDSIIKADSAAQKIEEEPLVKEEEPLKDTTTILQPEPEVNQEEPKPAVDTTRPEVTEPAEQEKPAPKLAVRYKVISKAYFHDTPADGSRREAFIVHWNNAVLTPLGDSNGFVYVEYTNKAGQTSKGWLRKADLKIVN